MTPTADAEHDAGDAAGGHGLGVGDHEEQEDEDLGRREHDPPEVGAADRGERPTRRDGVPEGGEDGHAGRQRQPEGQAHAEQAQATADEQATGEDHRVRGDHRRTDRRPPEVERLHPLASEQDERADERDVRRVEDVPAADTHEVLGHQAGEPDGDEQVPSVERPVPTLLGPDHPEQQGGARRRLERAGRPHEPARPGQHVGRLGQAAGEDSQDDLRHRQAEPEPTGADRDDREDRDRQVDPGVANARADDLDATATDGESFGAVGSPTALGSCAARRRPPWPPPFSPDRTPARRHHSTYTIGHDVGTWTPGADAGLVESPGARHGDLMSLMLGVVHATRVPPTLPAEDSACRDLVQPARAGDPPTDSPIAPDVDELDFGLARTGAAGVIPLRRTDPVHGVGAQPRRPQHVGADRAGHPPDRDTPRSGSAPADDAVAPSRSTRPSSS